MPSSAEHCTNVHVQKIFAFAMSIAVVSFTFSHNLEVVTSFTMFHNFTFRLNIIFLQIQLGDLRGYAGEFSRNVCF